MEFTEYDTRLAAYAVITDEEGRLLVTWYNGSGWGPASWSLPGGGVDYDETPEQGVAREVLEEAGYEVMVGPLLAADTLTDPAPGPGRRPWKGVRLYYAATIVGGMLGTREQDGTTDFATWKHPESIDEDAGRGGPVSTALRLLRDRLA
ncbi:NUDIX domain-containing protein [Brachybacterium sp. EF45031]|uniref:NUDIX hydrolase n=1 Tax=Brachybacterium sillae TaxID=2810536 RepID=UPI00217DBBBE|nr:NUDIX domain-containing protein [Brachybacterium sillae]MCS6712524.1 NUDIX domain-containing protein [Brachybacterium sillae]